MAILIVPKIGLVAIILLLPKSTTKPVLMSDFVGGDQSPKPFIPYKTTNSNSLDFKSQLSKVLNNFT